MKTRTLLTIAVLAAGFAPAAEINGTISSTLTITEDSALTGAVTCRVPGATCILVGAGCDRWEGADRGEYIGDARGRLKKVVACQPGGRCD